VARGTVLPEVHPVCEKVPSGAMRATRSRCDDRGCESSHALRRMRAKRLRHQTCAAIAQARPWVGTPFTPSTSGGVPVVRWTKECAAVVAGLREPRCSSQEGITMNEPLTFPVIPAELMEMTNDPRLPGRVFAQRHLFLPRAGAGRHGRGVFRPGIQRPRRVLVSTDRGRSSRRSCAQGEYAVFTKRPCGPECIMNRVS
jgi:hypothetical protein